MHWKNWSIGTASQRQTSGLAFDAMHGSSAGLLPDAFPAHSSNAMKFAVHVTRASAVRIPTD